MITYRRILISLGDLPLLVVDLEAVHIVFFLFQTFLPLVCACALKHVNFLDLSRLIVEATNPIKCNLLLLQIQE